MKERTSVDIIECCYCHEEIEPELELLGAAPMCSLSGTVEPYECEHCGMEQNVSPSIEWTTTSL